MSLSTAGDESAAASPVPAQSEITELRASLASMKERERRLMDLLNVTAPERIEHDLRNVLNELTLLRALFDPKSDDA